MPSNEQKTRKGPKMPTQEEIQQIKAQWEALDSDPEYQRELRKTQANFKKIALLNDSIQTKTN